MSIPTACQAIQDKINSVKQEAEDTSSRLNADPPPLGNERAAIVFALKRLRARLAELSRELEKCIVANGGSVEKPLDAILVGEGRFTTTVPGAAGPFSAPVEIGIRFSADRTGVGLTKFPDLIVSTPEVPLLGVVRYTISLIGGGIGLYGPDGRVDLPLALRFAPNKTIPFILGESLLNMTITTSTEGGSPLNPTGQLIAIGNGKFTEGPPLAPHDARLYLTGTVSPHP